MKTVIIRTTLMLILSALMVPWVYAEQDANEAQANTPPEAAPQTSPDTDESTHEITVTGTREERPRAKTAETVGRIQQGAITDAAPAHPAEILGQIPGVHVGVTGGEGHRTAIRQPMSTSPVYLFLEDGIPTRSTGFFNHNALYEVNMPQAGSIEVTKGPGTALYGSDAIGGVVNISTPAPPKTKEIMLNPEFGEFGWKRMLMSTGNSSDNNGYIITTNLTHTDGWRTGTDYDRRMLGLRWDHTLTSGATIKTIASIADINQRTAGSSRLNEFDYLNNPTFNYTPVSYRLVDALRLSAAYEYERSHSLLSITPYYRSNSMSYMPNWSFTYDPNISSTQNSSFGLLLKYRMNFKKLDTKMIMGMDIDYSPGSRLEHSIDALKVGNIYTSYAVTTKIYDYDVAFMGAAPYVHIESSPTSRLHITGGLRMDYIGYVYNNKMINGALVINPLSTAFPITYNHPADTNVAYTHLSPKLGLSYKISNRLNGFASYRHAFRAPSEGQLFRPGNSVNSINLKPVKADSYEIGLRGETAKYYRYELSLYYMLKTDDILTYTDAITGQRTTVNAGRTRHQGAEFKLETRSNTRWKAALALAYGEHIYDNWSPAAGVNYSGNSMQDAPRLIGNARLSHEPKWLNGGHLALEWVHLGNYWMDAANVMQYDGHHLFNLRLNYKAGKSWVLYGRIMNLADTRYATAAVFTGGAGQYAPGMPRTYYVGVRYTIK